MATTLKHAPQGYTPTLVHPKLCGTLAEPGFVSDAHNQCFDKELFLSEKVT